MGWVRRLQPYFSPLVQSRGRRYFQGGAVRITAGGPDNVRTSVRGSREYQVGVRLDRENVVVECDCPYFHSEDICKHVWATLLAAESANYLTRVAAAWSPTVTKSIDLAEERQEYEFTEPAQERRPQPPIPFRKPIKAQAASAWKKDVADIRRQSALHGFHDIQVPQRIFYVVDVAECISSEVLVVQCVASKL
jgi:uncharacterized Zn finger protein